METQIFAWMMDIFFIFTLHILYKQLLGVKNKSRLLLFLGWSICFVLWNAGSYLSMDRALISNSCTCMICFLALCFLYQGNLKAKTILVIVVVALGVIAEGIAVFLFGFLAASVNGYYVHDATFAYIVSAFSKIIWFMLVKIIATLSFRQIHIKIKMTDWIEIFLVPVGSILICYIIWWKRWNYINLSEIMILAILLVINIATYYMYQKIQTYAAECMDHELLKQQNEYFHLRYEEFEKQWLKLRRMRHDMANNCVLEMGYLEKGQYEQLMEHYVEKLGQIKQQGDMVDTGNIGIDSILNYKLEMAREYQIQVEKEIKIEYKVSINNIDLNILIGNLFDNAVEAVKELPVEKRKIDLFIRTSTTGLLLELCNPYQGKRVQDKAGDFLTNKKDTVYHGLGLKEVREIVKKYDGELIINDKGEKFGVKAFVYMNAEG